jgi:hypothetical protein
MPDFMVVGAVSALQSGKRARSVAMRVHRRKKKSGRQGAAIGFRQSSYGYPQKLWISVWMTHIRQKRKAYKGAPQSHWSFFSQPISSCFLK